MSNSHARMQTPSPASSDSLPRYRTRLSAEQMEALSRCARGISLRFEKAEIVHALIFAGYAERGVAGVVKITSQGREYLAQRATPAAASWHAEDGDAISGQ